MTVLTIWMSVLLNMCTNYKMKNEFKLIPYTKGPSIFWVSASTSHRKHVFWKQQVSCDILTSLVQWPVFSFCLHYLVSCVALSFANLRYIKWYNEWCCFLIIFWQQLCQSRWFWSVLLELYETGSRDLVGIRTVPQDPYLFLFNLWCMFSQRSLPNRSDNRVNLIKGGRIMPELDMWNKG